MNAASSKAKGPASSTVLLERLLLWCAFALIVTAGFWLQTHTFINHDVAWVLWTARQMLNGAQFGRDFFEPNLPFVPYSLMPAVWFADQLHLPVVAVFRGYVVLLTLSSLAICHVIMRRNDTKLCARQAWLFTLAAGTYLFVFCYRDFGQRELLAETFALPYLVMTAARLEGARFPILLASAVGIAAGIGFGLKPYFVVVPAVVELAGIAIRKDWRFAFRPEAIAMVLLILVYVAAILILLSPYVFDVIPVVLRVFRYNQTPFVLVLEASLIPLSALLFAVAGLWRLKFPALPTIFAAAALGFFVAYFVQMEGYTYHVFPLSMNAALALSLLVLPLAISNTRILTIATAGALAMLVADNTSNSAEWWQESQIGSGPYAQLTQKLIDEVNRRAGGGRFLAISFHPYPGFPIGLHVNATWSSRTVCQWFMAAVVHLREGTRPPDPDTLAFAERSARVFMLHDIETKPNIVLLEAGRPRLGIGNSLFDVLAFYLEDARFREEWSHYNEIQAIGPYRIFVRNTGDASRR